MKHSYSFIKKYFVQIIILFLLVVIVILLLKINSIKKTSGAAPSRDQGGNYVFTNPLLDFELPQGYKNSIISSEEARDFVHATMKKNDVSHISLYFRDLNNGPWIGINEKEYFSPASMLKTPLLIALLKWSEEDNSVLERKVIADSIFFQNVAPQHIVLEKSIEKNKSYTLIDLGKKMIQASDNVATSILYEQIPKKYIEETFTNIGVPFVSNGEDRLVRVKDIAGFYRVLFNASYLNRVNSEKALSILSETFYKEGLVKGIPKDVIVAHKFGERYPLENPFLSNIITEGDIQLHDCGIIYYPKTPYILCIMTRGSDFKNQEKSISEISQFFYTKVSK